MVSSPYNNRISLNLQRAAGLSVAIPALIFHRYFERRIEEFVIGMEQEALKMVEVFHGEREVISK